MKVELSDGRIFQVDYKWAGGDAVGAEIDIVYDSSGNDEVYVSPREIEERTRRNQATRRDPETWLDEATLNMIELYIIEHFDADDYYADSDLDRL